ncbi:response regulator transcription factor [Chryseobacterium sp. EO14]|uniref:response regulator transcription factor n=1 Tax=Chryseobacterium sp. EO14 TaxID=2950551 RepID=UPI00210BE568|nr:response regulator transcription factor [Chryseobacterium sp. EO14]MCQ4142364.1 response regulator transcription factor [Chryseobacterium sp. EO14]
MKKLTHVVIIEDDLEFALLQKLMVNEMDNHFCEKVYLNPIEFLNENEVKADVILLDILMPEMNGLEAIPNILKKYENISIVINSIQDDTQTILTALRLGAVGYIDKQNFDKYLYEVLYSIKDNGAFMTPKIARKVFDFFNQKLKKLDILTQRERDVAIGIIDGLSYKLVAYKLSISIETVRMNVKSIYKKYKINSKSELISLIYKGA